MRSGRNLKTEAKAKAEAEVRQLKVRRLRIIEIFSGKNK
jgi:hypothetical protein